MAQHLTVDGADRNRRRLADVIKARCVGQVEAVPEQQTAKSAMTLHSAAARSRSRTRYRATSAPARRRGARAAVDLPGTHLRRAALGGVLADDGFFAGCLGFGAGSRGVGMAALRGLNDGSRRRVPRSSHASSSQRAMSSPSSSSPIAGQGIGADPEPHRTRGLRRHEQPSSRHRQPRRAARTLLSACGMPWGLEPRPATPARLRRARDFVPKLDTDS